MSSSWKASFVCILLFSFLAIGTGAAPVHADYITYDFYATGSTDSSTYGVWGFSFRYVDIAGTGVAMASEIVPGSVVFDQGLWSFPGAPLGFFLPLALTDQLPSGRYTGGLTQVDPWYTDYLGVPYDVPTWTVFGMYSSFFGIIEQSFSLPSSYWTYGETPEAQVPIPPTALLLASGLLGLAGWRRLRKS